MVRRHGRQDHLRAFPLHPGCTRNLFRLHQVERKTHREDWTGEKSVKARFPIKEDVLNAFLSGEHTMDATFEAIRAKGKKSDKEVDSMIKLAREVQAAVKVKRLGPGTFVLPGLTAPDPYPPNPSHAHVLQPHRVPTPRRRACAHLVRHPALAYPRGQLGRPHARR